MPRAEGHAGHRLGSSVSSPPPSSVPGAGALQVDCDPCLYASHPHTTGVPTQEAKRCLDHEALHRDRLSGFRQAKRPVHVGTMVMLNLQEPGVAAIGCME